MHQSILLLNATSFSDIWKERLPQVGWINFVFEIPDLGSVTAGASTLWGVTVPGKRVTSTYKFEFSTDAELAHTLEAALKR